jgi:hypothetical protein
MTTRFRKEVGAYDAMIYHLHVFAVDGCGGKFDLLPDDGLGIEVCVGVDLDWHSCVGTLVHELGELFLTARGRRYMECPDIGRDMGAFLFNFTHAEFSELTMFIGDAMCECSGDLYKVWKTRQKELKSEGKEGNKDGRKNLRRS